MALNRSLLAINLVKQRLPQYQAICKNSNEVIDRSGFDKIGNRDFLCYGLNGQPTYFDRIDYPCPSIRFKENTPDVMVLREKEKGDWKKLSIAEKKALYRASFCQTFAEVYAPTGDWKMCVGAIFLGGSCVILAMVALAKFVLNPMPETLSEENKARLVQKMIDQRVNPVTGFASNYDYENNRWKE